MKKSYHPLALVLAIVILSSCKQSPETFAIHNPIFPSNSEENPAISRSCEEGKEEIRFNDGGYFEILLSADSKIKSYKVTCEGKQIISQPIPERIMKKG